MGKSDTIQNRNLLKTAMGFVAILFFAQFSLAQDQISAKNESAEEGKDLRVTISFPLQPIVSATLRYKAFDNADWRTVEARPEGQNFIAVIPGEFVAPPSIMYYVQAKLGDGRVLTFPVNTPTTTPVITTVRPKPEDERLFIISPTPGEKIRPEDLIVVYSFYRISDKVARFRVVLSKDGSQRDVTNQTTKSENTLTFIPEEGEIEDGVYSVEVVLFDKDNKPIAQAKNNFTMTGSGKFDEYGNEVPPAPGFTYLSDTWVEGRQEKQTFARTVQSLIDPSLPPTIEFADTNLTYIRFNTNLDTKINGWLRIGGNVYLTNEERANAQAANRFLIKLETDVLSLRYGDVFPEYSYYLTNGVRVRGIEADLRLGGFRATVTQGEANRAFEAVSDTVITLPVANDTIAAIVQRDQDNGVSGIWTLVDSTAAGKTYRRITTAGSFKRSLTTGVIGLDTDHFKFLLSVLKSRDEIGINEFNTRGVRPQDNLALGGTLQLSIVPEHFDLFGDFGIGASNRDITGGSLTPEQFERLTDQKITADQIRNIPGGYDFITNLITLNANLNPLNPLDLSSLAFRGGANLTISSNYLRAEFIRQGQNYQSFGLAFYQPDIQGFRVNDRLRLFGSKVILNAGFENMKDNLLGLRNKQAASQTLDGTVTRQLIRGGVSTFLGGGAPNFRLEVQAINNSNAIPLVYRDSVTKLETGSVAILGNRSGLSARVDNSTTMISGDVQKAFTMADNSEISFTLLGTLTSRNDNRDLSRPKTTGGTSAVDTIRYSTQDLGVLSQDFTSTNFGFSTTYSIPNSIRASLAYSAQGLEYFGLNEVNAPTLIKQNFSSLDAALGFNFFENKLRPMLRASFTFGDFSRSLFGFIVAYDINSSMNLAGDFAYSTVGGIASNGVQTPNSNNIVAALRFQMVFGNQ